MSYLVLKHAHIGAVVVSFGLFFLRGVWMIDAPQKLQARWVRIVPHVIDTILLVSAIALAVLTAQYPFVQPWLTAKILALVAYIVLGSVALKRGRTRAHRLAAWLLALAVFAYIVAVALTRDPMPWRA
ncbi:MAG: SirB2 family protein [Betaproteobacteria bacterium]